MTLLLLIAACGVVYTGYRLSAWDDASLTDEERAQQQEDRVW